MNSPYHQIHYGVFHAVLPVALKSDVISEFKDSVSNNLGSHFILELWNRYQAARADLLIQNGGNINISVADISVSFDDSFREGHLYVIKTPPTIEPLEAAYVAVAVAHNKPGESVRYFTFEMPMEEGLDWVIGEVHSLGRRSNHGAIQEMSLNAFKNAVLSMLGWEKTELFSAPQSPPNTESWKNSGKDEALRKSVPVPSRVREGQIRPLAPDFFPDLTSGLFAASGLRGPIRFVSNGKSVGLYSTQRGLRSKFINRGAIIKIDNQQIRYFVSDLSERDPVDHSDVEKRHGPLLNFQEPITTNGTHSVTVSMEETRPTTRTILDQNIYNAASEPKPTLFPYFWNYRHRYATWLAKSSMPIFYELDGAVKDAYQALVDVGNVLGEVGGCFYDNSEQFVNQSLSRKGAGGVSSVLDTEPMVVGTFPSKHLQLNFQPLSFLFGRGFLYFLPEEFMFVGPHGRCIAVPYSGLKYRRKTGVRIGIPTPAWAQPIGYVWQYMNKDGSPDRRYNNNLQIPEYQTWELDFSFGAGTTLDTAFLDKQSLDNFVAALDRLIYLSTDRRTPQL
jgi:hypothetical protein